MDSALKCTADAGQFFRMVYPEKVVRGYHCPSVQQPYWNTVFLNDFPDDVLIDMIDLAYDTVYKKLSKKIQEEIERNIWITNLREDKQNDNFQASGESESMQRFEFIVL